MIRSSELLSGSNLPGNLKEEFSYLQIKLVKLKLMLFSIDNKQITKFLQFFH